MSSRRRKGCEGRPRTVFGMSYSRVSWARTSWKPCLIGWKNPGSAKALQYPCPPGITNYSYIWSDSSSSFWPNSYCLFPTPKAWPSPSRSREHKRQAAGMVGSEEIVGHCSRWQMAKDRTREFLLFFTVSGWPFHTGICSMSIDSIYLLSS